MWTFGLFLLLQFCFVLVRLSVSNLVIVFSSTTQYLTQCQTFSSVDMQLQMFLLFVFFFSFYLAFFSPLINGSMATSTDGYYIAKQCQCSALYFYIYAPSTLTCSLNIFQEFLLKKKKKVKSQVSQVGLGQPIKEGDSCGLAHFFILAKIFVFGSSQKISTILPCQLLLVKLGSWEDIL